MAMVSNGLVTNEKTIMENPELVERMTRAFVRGLQYTMAHPDEAYEICLKVVDNLKDVENQNLQKRVLEETISLYAPEDGRPLGTSDPASWQTMADVMRKMGYLEVNIDVNDVFTNDFIPDLRTEP